jgi:hypothetical protein
MLCLPQKVSFWGDFVKKSTEMSPNFLQKSNDIKTVTSKLGFQQAQI